MKSIIFIPAFVVLVNFSCMGQNSINKYSFFGRLYAGDDTSCIKYYFNLANRDIANGEPKLLAMGPGEYPDFKKKYGVQYMSFGCVALDDKNCLTIYNNVIFKYLNSKFGRKWRRRGKKWQRQFRTDVIGF